VQWKLASSPSTKKFKVTPYTGKVMLNMFWDSQGILLAHFQKYGENVNSASYCEVLLKLEMQFAENIQANWRDGYCFIMTIPDPKQPEQPRREFKNYSRNFLNICHTAWIWFLLTPICLAH
jgi:hypothetical protein